MPEIDLEDNIRLHVLVEDIQEQYWKREGKHIYGLRLFKANASPESVASVWPSKVDVEEQLVHLIVRPKIRKTESASQAAIPPSSEFSKLIADFNKGQTSLLPPHLRIDIPMAAQLSFIQTVKQSASSSAAMPSKFRAQQEGPNFINIGRPFDTGLPIFLYHPVFGRFLRRLQSTDPIDPEVYNHTRAYFSVSQNLYGHETDNSKARERGAPSQDVLHDLLGNIPIKLSTKNVPADGGMTSQDHYSTMIVETRNEIGIGESDPTIQAAQLYTKYWSDMAARHWINWCCCPSILVVIAGPWMCILGAVFLTRPVIQPLTGFLWVGENPTQPSEFDYLARVFDSLNLARNELEDYYGTSNPPTAGQNPARPFPYITGYLDSMGEYVRFAYKKSPCDSSPGKSIFLAETIDIENPGYIVVKFVQSYNSTAHRLLAENHLAPELLYDGTAHLEDQPGPEHIMIVMEHVQAMDLEQWSSSLPPSVFSDIEVAVDLLHSQEIVFGDLREPNIMILHDSSGRATGRAMLVDFDWCGQHLEDRYPLRMNMTLGWDEGVGPGTLMDMRHDIYMLEKLVLR